MEGNSRPSQPSPGSHRRTLRLGRSAGSPWQAFVDFGEIASLGTQSGAVVIRKFRMQSMQDARTVGSRLGRGAFGPRPRLKPEGFAAGDSWAKRMAGRLLLLG